MYFNFGVGVGNYSSCQYHHIPSCDKRAHSQKCPHKAPNIIGNQRSVLMLAVFVLGPFVSFQDYIPETNWGSRAISSWLKHPANPAWQPKSTAEDAYQPPRSRQIHRLHGRLPKIASAAEKSLQINHSSEMTGVCFLSSKPV
jgi:hypothetical protein